MFVGSCVATIDGLTMPLISGTPPLTKTSSRAALPTLPSCARFCVMSTSVPLGRRVKLDDDAALWPMRVVKTELELRFTLSCVPGP